AQELRRLSAELQEAKFALDRNRSTDWELRVRISRQREIAAKRCASSLSSSAVKGVLLAWRLAAGGGALAVRSLAQDRVLCAVATAAGRRFFAQAALALWRQASQLPRKERKVINFYSKLVSQLGMASVCAVFAAWRGFLGSAHQEEAPLRSVSVEVPPPPSEADEAEMLLRGFCSWRLALFGRLRLRSRQLRESQVFWEGRAVLLSAAATWRQFSKRSRSLRWGWQAQSLALLRAVLGTWRLAVFELRGLPSPGIAPG
ncbi:unnamed protein product, partial [Polarella glacialis]